MRFKNRILSAVITILSLFTATTSVALACSHVPPHTSTQTNQAAAVSAFSDPNVSPINTLPENCQPTQTDIEGPYYKPDSPFQANIAPDNAQGQKLVIRGVITDTDCRTPIQNATVDVWQADANGQYYDNAYRGKVITNEQGEYTFQTINPGRYLFEGTYRPPHIHLKVSAPGYPLLTTQIYLNNDGTENQTHQTLTVIPQVVQSGNIFYQAGTFNIVLPR